MEELEVRAPGALLGLMRFMGAVGSQFTEVRTDGVRYFAAVRHEHDGFVFVDLVCGPDTGMEWLTT